MGIEFMGDVSSKGGLLEKEKWEKQERPIIEMLLKEKLAILRIGQAQELGAENFIKLSQYLYQAIFHPENIEKLIEDLKIEDSQKHPNRIKTLRQPLLVFRECAPAEEDFVQIMVKTLTEKSSYENCINDGAEDQLRNMANIGPVRIWTTGDANGLYDKKGNFVPGSKGQLKKIVTAGVINDLRNEVANNLYPGNDKPADYYKKRKDALTVIAAEDKFELIESIAKEFIEKNIDVVVIIEDTLKYLIRAEDEIIKYGLSVLPIWIRQGDRKYAIPKHEGHDIEYYLKKYNAQDSVSGISDVMKSYDIDRESRAAFIVDYDDVIMNSAKKIEIQGNALVQAFRENGWI